MLDDEDKASLIAWTKYGKALRKLNLSGVSDEAGYSAITWPECHKKAAAHLLMSACVQRL
ncbi:tail fiber assembly protein (plasmid) [Pantoea alfalfae]|uniref:tail fiber assembly protein n=1 Tax=Pantoea alfalfae TaxID=3074822 RepID=UPI001CA3AF35|nr:tail fiber assembly protein [Pantoea alfalfae]